MAKNPHAQALGKLGGASKSEVKSASSRKNGKKGGRPPLQPQIDRLMAEIAELRQQIRELKANRH
jgi:ribosomal protein L19E